MSRISFAFRSFFSILFGGTLPPDIAQAFGYSKAMPVKAAPVKAEPAPKPVAGPADGAVQILSILQRDARLVDFLMEDISAYADDQVGAAVRDVQTQARESLNRYLSLNPVIDGVEGTFTKMQGINPAQVKLIGNVPADGKAPGGTLRHKGWKASKVDLPQIAPGQVLAPAELEIE
ncbi:MAG TPA: DUF2760 domain-containing protein [Bryobacteraceae bacterium]